MNFRENVTRESLCDSFNLNVFNMNARNCINVHGLGAHAQAPFKPPLQTVCCLLDNRQKVLRRHPNPLTGLLCVPRGSARWGLGEQALLIDVQHVYLVECIFLAIPVADELQVLDFAQLGTIVVIVLVKLDYYGQFWQNKMQIRPCYCLTGAHCLVVLKEVHGTQV